MKLPPGTDLEEAGRLLERLCAEEGLVRTMETSLKVYPGSRHWHYRRGSERGTLEVTVWPGGGKAWISAHANRAGRWTAGSAERLALAVERVLAAEERAGR